MRHGREILLAMRFELDLYINLRPVKCLSDALCPLKNKTAADINFTVFRENTEDFGYFGGAFLVGGTWVASHPPGSIAFRPCSQHSRFRT